MRRKPVLVPALLAASSMLLMACGSSNSSSPSTSNSPIPAASTPNSPPAGSSPPGSGSGSGSGSSGGTQGGFAEKKFSLPSAGHMLAADFNRDGRPDLLIYGSSLEILINGGSGEFQNATSISIPSPYVTLTQVALADFNGDGFADIVACANSANGSAGAAVVYLNDGSGRVNVTKVLPTPAACKGVAAGDANRDGKADFAVAYRTGSSSAPDNAIVTWFGDGTGNFANPVTQSSIVLAQMQDSTVNPCGIASATGGDFDQNGTMNLILFGACQPNAVNPGNVYVARGDGSGHYMLAEITESNTSITGSPYVKDINGDGKPDVVYLDEQFGPHGSNVSELMFAVNNGSGTFAVSRAASESAYAGSGSSLRAGSPLASGLAVIGFAEFPCCAAATYGVKLMRQGSGDVLQTWIYGQSNSASPGDVTGVASADFDGNGAEDFAAVEHDQNNNSVLHVYLNATK